MRMWRAWLARRTWQRQAALLEAIKAARRREAEYITAMLADDTGIYKAWHQEEARTWRATRARYVAEFMRLQRRFEQLTRDMHVSR